MVTSRIVSMVAFLLFVTPCLAGPRILWQDDPEAEPMLQTVEKFWKGIESGSASDAFSACAIDKSSAHHKVVEALLRQREAAKDLLAYARANAPEDRIGAFSNIMDIAATRLSTLHAMPVIISGNRASIPSMGWGEAGLILERITEGWRVVQLAHSDVEADAVESTLNRLVGASHMASSWLQKNPNASWRDFEENALNELGETWVSWSVNLSAAQKRVSPPSNPPCKELSGEQLQSFLGKLIRDDEVAAAIAKMPGLPSLSTAGGTVFFRSREAGISMTCEGPIQGIALYTAGIEGFQQFGGTLPHGLRFDMSRRDVERLLGEPTTIGAYESQVWTSYELLNLSVNYAGGPRDPKARITDIGMQLPRDSKPMPLGDLTAQIIREGAPPSGEKTFPEPNAKNTTLRVSLYPEVVFDASMIEAIEPTMSDSKTRAIVIKLNQVGADRVVAASKTWHGARLALVVGDTIILAASIGKELSRDLIIDLGKDCTLEEYMHIMSALNRPLFRLPPE